MEMLIVTKITELTVPSKLSVADVTTNGLDGYKK